MRYDEHGYVHHPTTHSARPPPSTDARNLDISRVCVSVRAQLKFEIPANLDESEEYLNKLTATDFHEAHALKQNELAPEQNERIGWLIKDLEYLDEMAKMEEPEYKSTNFHIVPVSGLVLSQLLRYQNECKTVLELWDRSESSELASRPALSLAVLVLDWDEVNRLTKGAVDANAQDANGWTPLHFACATSVADSNRLRVRCWWLRYLACLLCDDALI